MYTWNSYCNIVSLCNITLEEIINVNNIMWKSNPPHSTSSHVKSQPSSCSWILLDSLDNNSCLWIWAKAWNSTSIILPPEGRTRPCWLRPTSAFMSKRKAQSWTPTTDRQTRRNERRDKWFSIFFFFKDGQHDMLYKGLWPSVEWQGTYNIED